MGVRRGWLAVLACAVLAAGCASGGTSSVVRPGKASDPVIVAAGDIACNSLPSDHARRCQYDDVAALIRELAPAKFLALGDLQYLHGDYTNFLKYYDRYFHDLKDITAPVPGNHETYTRYMRGYFHYFGGIAMPDGWAYPNHAGYYSFDLGSWHIIGLNSQVCKGTTWSPVTGPGAPITQNPAESDGCHVGSAMYEWLAKDLALHPNDQYPCTLAFFHHPLFAWWPYKQTVENLHIQPIWRLLDDNGVDVILNGHYHNYQRWAPQNAYGFADANGITEIIVGTGGDTFENDFPVDSEQPPANLVSYQASSFGVLKMQLHPTSGDFSFVPAPGQEPFDDSGTIQCQ